MDRVIFCPSAGTWSFGPIFAFPFAYVFPPGNPGGEITLSATTAGSTPVNGQGAQFTVSIDGGGPGAGPCLENGSYTVTIPPGATTLDISVAKGCNGGPDTTDADVAGAGP